MRLLEFKASNILIRDLVGALAHYFDMERVGGDSRIYQVGGRKGVIYMLNNSLRAVGLIYATTGNRVESVGVWHQIDLDRSPDYVTDIPEGANLIEIIDPLVKFIKQPREGIVEGVLFETSRRNVSPDEFVELARKRYGEKAEKLSFNDLKDLSDHYGIHLPSAIRLNPALKVDGNHWNLAHAPGEPTQAGVASVVQDLKGSGELVLMGRKPTGELFEIPGVNAISNQLDRMLKNMIESGKGPEQGGSSMERQYDELEKKITMIAGGQSEFIKSLLITGMPSAGKALALDTLLPTPSGWTTMGEVQEGDELFDESGNVCRVTSVTPVQYDRTCYEMRFSDGSKVIADADHRWWVTRLASRQNGESRLEIITTGEMAPKLRCGSKWNFRIPNAAPIQVLDKTYSIHPYVLGAWLGDGTASGPTITVGEKDRSAMAAQLAAFERVSCVETSRKGVHTIRISPFIERDNKVGNDFKNRLRDLGVLDNKHIPAEYLRGSVQQRLALLQGLMDTDGTVDRSGRCEFCVSDERLATGALELIRSLGIKAHMKRGPTFKKDRFRICFTTQMPVFELARKAERLAKGVNKSSGYRSIVACEPIASVPVKCITVDSPNSLFLCTENFIPTHNTFRVMKVLKEMGLSAGEHYVTKKGKISAKALYRVLIQQLHGLAVFDDCDSVVKDENGVNMLKGALDTDPVRTVDYDVQGLMNTDAMSFERRGEIVGAMSAILRGVPTEAELEVIEALMGKQAETRAKAKNPSKQTTAQPARQIHPDAAIFDPSIGWDDDDDNEDVSERISDMARIREAEEFVMNNLPNKIDFYGRIIFISNMTPAQWAEVGDGAIISRAFTQDMNFPDNEMLDYIDTIKDHIKTPRLSDDQKTEVLAYLRELWEAGKVNKPINFRLVQSSFDLFLLNGWKELVAANCQ